MKSTVAKQLRRRQRRLERRLRRRQRQERKRRLFPDRNVRYDYSARFRAGPFGGLGVCFLLAQRLKLADALDAKIHLLKRHLPYHESDHILNLVYNILAGGTTLGDIERLRTDDLYLDALGVPCIPAPSTAGDFLRRFGAQDIDDLMDVINDKRLLVWRQQPKSFFEHAVIDADGTIADTDAACKEGMDLSYKGQWGYHPLVVSLAHTQEPLFIHNRPASRPSHEDAAGYLDRAAVLCRTAGFLRITLRGDTDFSQTAHLDGWHDQDLRFVFGIDAMPKLVALAGALAAGSWQRLVRPPRYEVKTEHRTRPAAVKEEVVERKGYKNLRLLSEDVAAFDYRPGACCRDYRVVVLRKNIVEEKGGVKVADQVRYFFYITNEAGWSAADVIHFANDRCNQENLIEQLKNGVEAMRLPSNTLVSNWAYMVIAALAWSMKAWLALVQPHKPHRAALLGMEFKGFLRGFLTLTCQVVLAGRQVVYRLLQYNEWVPVLLRTAERLRGLVLT